MAFLRQTRAAASAVHPAALGSSTASTQLLNAQAFGMRSSGPRRSKRAKTARRVAAPRRARKASRRPARLVKGSAAAKRYMASIRRKRR